MFCRSITDHLFVLLGEMLLTSVLEALLKPPNLKHVLHLPSLYLAEMIEDHLEKFSY